MKILGIDTTSQYAALAIAEDATILSEHSSERGSLQGVALAAELQNLLHGLNLRPENLDLIAVGLGPGSYTGMRIGVTAARTLALACGVQLIGICSMDARARRAGDRPATVLVNGWQQQFYVAEYAPGVDGPQRKGDVEIVGYADAPARLRKDHVILYDSGLEKLADLSAFDVRTGEAVAPVAAEVIRLGMSAFERQGPTAPADLHPMYLRRTPAEERWDERAAAAPGKEA